MCIRDRSPVPRRRDVHSHGRRNSLCPVAGAYPVPHRWPYNIPPDIRVRSEASDISDTHPCRFYLLFPCRLSAPVHSQHLSSYLRTGCKMCIRDRLCTAGKIRRSHCGSGKSRDRNTEGYRYADRKGTDLCGDGRV